MKQKIVAITGLYTVTIFIMISGLSFSVYSLSNHVYFRVLNSNIHGAIFGITVCYLGIRYFINVRKLKAEVMENANQFSWSNFKREKNQKLYYKSIK